MSTQEQNIQGEWTLEWGVNTGIKQAGLINFEAGIISGGDSDHRYSGHYQTESDECIKGTIEVTNKNEEAVLVFGKKSKYKVNFTGEFGIAKARVNKRALMIIDSQLGDGPAHFVRIICEK